MEDQTGEVVDQIGKREFRFSTRDANGSDEKAEPVLLMGKHMLDAGTIDDFLALARAVDPLVSMFAAL